MATLLQLCQPFDHAVMAVIQQLSGAMMDKIMLVFTFLGEETFAILLLIAVYWCWDKRIGEYLLFSLYTAMSLNGLLKDIICRPRPFLNDEFSDLRYVKVKGLLVDTEHLSSSWSFPSGHSQTAGSIYGSLINGRKLGIKVCGIAVILLVMLSRVYLGVHYPTDTIVGAVLGLLVLFLPQSPERTVGLIVTGMVICELFSAVALTILYRLLSAPPAADGRRCAAFRPDAAGQPLRRQRKNPGDGRGRCTGHVAGGRPGGVPLRQWLLRRGAAAHFGLCTYHGHPHRP